MLTYISRVKRKLTLALVIASAVTILELLGGIFSNSIALLSDAGHMFGDVMAISLSLFAIGLAAKKHTKKLTYGYHRAEVLSALTNGIILAVIGALIAKEAYMRLIEPPTIDATILIGVATIGLVANAIIALMLKETRKTSINVKAAYLHVFYDAVSSVGVIVGGTLVVLTNYYVIDPIIAFIIAGLIAKGAFKILRESVHILLEGTPSNVDLKKIFSEIKSVEGVFDIHDLHVWTISSGINVLSGHVIVKDQMVSQSARIIEEIGVMLRVRFNISHTTIQVESEQTFSDIKYKD
ncbi:MAG: cation diffusion facilitator family transporter [Nitrososphaerales archaeon]